jgi:hypothetical protein
MRYQRKGGAARGRGRGWLRSRVARRRDLAQACPVEERGQGGPQLRPSGAWYRSRYGACGPRPSPGQALDLLGRIPRVAALPRPRTSSARRPAALGRFDRLAVDYSGPRSSTGQAWAGFTSGSLACFEQEFEIDPLEQAIIPPVITVSLASWWTAEILWQHAPLTAGPSDMHNAIEDRPQTGLARPPQILAAGIKGSITAHSASVRSLA